MAGYIRHMNFDPHIAATRFGTGLSARHAPPATLAALVAELEGADAAAARWPITPFRSVVPSFAELNAARAATRTDDMTAAETAQAAYREMQIAAQQVRRDAFSALLARGARAEWTLRERLSLFWADHFTVRARAGFTRHMVQSYVEEAIRPNITARFGQMLFAVTIHPMMLIYLDQQSSSGPNSQFGRNRDRGLNENLARELLELHTLGVGGGYSQRDVTELAELLTGLFWRARDHSVFQPNRAEPGPETVLGRTYSSEARLSNIRDVCEDLAVHPATAQHMARKLAVHFVSDTPPENLVTELASVWMETGGDLLDVTRALIEHPASWTQTRAKVRRPIEYIIAALRALDVDPAVWTDMNRAQMRRAFGLPLAAMAQPWNAPAGPDGWAEETANWVTPQAMATRIDWALTMPSVLSPDLPDPRDFVAHALGPLASRETAFAARAAEDRAAGIGLVLASPEFQRR